MTGSGDNGAIFRLPQTFVGHLAVCLAPNRLCCFDTSMRRPGDVAELGVMKAISQGHSTVP